MNKKNALRIMLAVLALAGISIPLASCQAKATTSTETSLASVRRGDLTNEITSGGNLALSKKEDLAFDVGGTAAAPVTVAEILVTEGESVTEGQVIARLDTDTLEEALETAELAVKNTEIALEDAKDGEFKVKTAEFDLQTAVDSFNKLSYPYTTTTFTQSVPDAMFAVNQAIHRLEDIEKGLNAGPETEDYDEITNALFQAKINLSNAFDSLNVGQAMASSINSETYVLDDDPLSPTYREYVKVADWDFSAASSASDQVKSAVMAVEKAQQTLEQTKRSTKSTLDKAAVALEKAQDDLKKAQDNVAKAVITAPFTGFITNVNVEGGDEIQRGTVAVTIADPAKFEAEIMVGESDIFKIQEGGEATIQIDAMSVIVLPATVAHISPTGTVSSGVVNYEVRVEATSLQPVGLSQIQQQSGSGQSTSGTGQVAGAVTSQLREGLSVTVNVILSERQDVLMVPNGAITRTGRDTTVQVMKDGVPETRSIKVGLSNWQYTEVTEGLSEGEQVVVPLASSTSTSTSQNQPGGGVIFGPGMGGR